eukprot:2534403-Rhodomonas_salina.1
MDDAQHGRLNTTRSALGQAALLKTSFFLPLRPLLLSLPRSFLLPQTPLLFLLSNLNPKTLRPSAGLPSSASPPLGPCNDDLKQDSWRDSALHVGPENFSASGTAPAETVTFRWTLQGAAAHMHTPPSHCLSDSSLSLSLRQCQ